MGWLIPRLLAATVAVIAGGLVGMLVGNAWHWPALGALLGAATAALVHAFVDAWRGHRFMNWLRGKMEHPAPRDAGFWGEVGYRVERLLLNGVVARGDTATADAIVIATGGFGQNHDMLQRLYPSAGEHSTRAAIEWADETLASLDEHRERYLR